MRDDDNPGYHSLYGGIVVSNEDPKKLGRCKLKVGVIGDQFPTEWALPAQMISGVGSGDFRPPPKDAAVFVMFLEGDPEHPVYIGGYFASPGGVSDVPEEFQRNPPTNRGYKSPGGHLIEYDDGDDTKGVRVTTAGKFKINLSDKNKKAVIETPDGNKIELDDENQKLSITAKKDMSETVEGDSTVTVKGKRDEKVDGDSSVTVKGKRTETIDGELSATIKGKVEVKSEADIELSVQTGKIVLKSLKGIIVDGQRVLIGSDSASEPFVLGTQLSTLLTTVITLILSHVHPGVLPGPSSTGPSPSLAAGLPPQLASIAAGTIVATNIFGEKV